MRGEPADKLIADVVNRLSYHPVRTGDQADRYNRNRHAAIQYARTLIADADGPSRELSLALTHVQDALMWANAGIACHVEPAPATKIVTRAAHELLVGDIIHTHDEDRTVRSVEQGTNGFLWIGVTGLPDLIQVAMTLPVLVVVDTTPAGSTPTHLGRGALAELADNDPAVIAAIADCPQPHSHQVFHYCPTCPWTSKWESGRPK